jgi:glycerol uptake facilitator-like aquaporin
VPFPVARALPAEAMGTFALVFAGAGAVMVDARTHQRSLGPAVVSGDLHALWLYLVAPVLGASLGGLGYQFVRGEAP